jgi:hypothetical protein
MYRYLLHNAATFTLNLDESTAIKHRAHARRGGFAAICSLQGNGFELSGDFVNRQKAI